MVETICGPRSVSVQINWSKTILQVSSPATRSSVSVAEGQLKVVKSFVYLDNLIETSDGSRGEVLRQIGTVLIIIIIIIITRQCLWFCHHA